MQCAPHTLFPHCTEPHCVPPCTPHPASKRQITTTTEGGTRWMRMNECSPSIPPLPAHPSTPPAPNSPLPFHPCLPSYMPLFSPTLRFRRFCRPVLWLWTHISVSATPPSGHPYKGLSFQRSGLSPTHKCCPDTSSGKIKAACLPAHVQCLSVVAVISRGRWLRCPFPFLLLLSFFIC